MPAADRTYPVGVGPAAPDPAARDRAVAVLTGDALAGVVDLVAWPDGGWLHVANHAGAARVRRGPGSPDDWEILSGRSPVAVQDPLHGTPLAASLADPSPPNARNSYPHAAARLRSVFADPDRSPDVIVVHAAAHFFPARGGHPGEHGSLDAGQSRAPLLLGSPGGGDLVPARGILPRAARTVDVAPTLARLAGADFPACDGQPLDIARPGARHVVGLLWDGVNAADLLALADAGEAPAVARLLAGGCALAGGAVAEFPSVTLVNHTSALTGVGPGRHGIVHNVFYDRAARDRVVANDAATWHRACDLLRPGVTTVFEAVGGRTACVNEPVDRGADFSTFALVRASGRTGGAGALRDQLPSPADDPYATTEYIDTGHIEPGHTDTGDADQGYTWSTQVDAFGLAQVRSLWAAPAEPPGLMWWNTTLTDSAHHAGGPYSPIARASIRDADRRLGEFFAVLDERGLAGDTVVLLTADHGSEGADPACTGGWDEALRAADIPFRDEGYGFIYLDVGGA